MVFPIITLAGGSCSGKTTFIEGFKHAVVVSLDNFYKDIKDLKPEADGTYNFDIPEAFDLEECKTAVLELASGHDVEIPTYDYVSCKRTGTELIKAPKEEGWIVVLEGIFVLHQPLQSLGELRIFIDAPLEVRIARRIRRDVSRGRDPKEIIKTFVSVEEGHQKYIEPYKKFANLVVPFSFSPIVFSQ